MEDIKVGLLTLSNPAHKATVEEFSFRLERSGIEVEESPLLYESCSAKERAEIFNTMMKENKYDFIIDVSGGDLASVTLPYLDFEAYGKSKSIFVGYSDLTSVCNGLNQICHKPTLWFQPVFHHPFTNVVDWLKGNKEESGLFRFETEDINYGLLEGEMIGGNIRCLLKTAGTPYFPDVEGKVLFLEGNSGDYSRVYAYLAQLFQMGVFSKIKGLLFGQFTQLDDAYGYETSTKMLMQILEEMCGSINMPVYRTRQIGHSRDSKACWIGRKVIIR